MNSVQKILVQRADRLGDVIFTLPVIETLKSAYPKAEIHILTSSIGASFLKDYPGINYIYTIDAEKASWRSLFKLSRDLKKQQYDSYISIWNHPKMALLGWLAGIPIRIGDSTNPTLKGLYTHPVTQKWNDFTQHQVEFNLSLLKVLKVPSYKQGVIYSDPEAKKRVQSWRQKYLEPNRKIVILFAATGGTNRPIPLEASRIFCEKLLKTGEFNIIICGQSEKDQAIKPSIKKGFLDLTNKTTINELIAIIEDGDFYVGPDTGPTHIAATLQKPILFFSPKKELPPSRWGPRTPYFKVIRQDSAVQDITAEQLMTHFEELLHQVQVHDAYSDEEIKRQHLLHSYRVLYVVRTREALNDGQKRLKAFELEGFRVFIEPVRVWTPSAIIRLIKLAIRHNITVLQGDIPFWVVVIVRCYIGLVCQYIKPIHIPVDFKHYITLNDYLDMYRRRWQGLPLVIQAE